MSKAPAMPMYWDAYLADTTHLTTEEHGAYMLLLAAMWRRNAWVPDDDKDNARILGLTPSKWRKIKARLMETVSGFRVEDGKITQEKLQKTWENTQEKIGKNRANGAKGGRPKTRKNNNIAKANGSVSVNPNESIPDPDPDPEPEVYNTSNEVYVIPTDEIAEAVSAYNAAADRAGWPKVQKLTTARRSSLKARLKDVGGAAGWSDALAKAEASDFLCARTPQGFTASFDFLTRQSSFAKLMEGNYDNRHSNNGRSPTGSGTVDAFAAVARRLEQARCGGNG